MSKILARLRTPVFQNTGSTARDHLASERTFLAWIRTGLGFIALGIAVERFSQLDIEELIASIQSQTSRSNPPLPRSVSRHEAVLVPILLGTGTGSIVYGTTRYFRNLGLIERGLFTPAFHGVSLLSVSCAAMAGAAYWGMLRHEKDRTDTVSRHRR